MPSGIFYIGTLGEYGEGFSRESIEYWRKRKDAEKAFTERRWTPKLPWRSPRGNFASVEASSPREIVVRLCARCW